MFWSGADFEEEKLNVKGKKFIDAFYFITMFPEINSDDLKRWLKKAIKIQ